jgi:hypothetical protein
MKRPPKTRLIGPSRRDFLKQAGAALAIGNLVRRSPAISPQPNPPKIFMSEFDYGDVRLTGGPFKDHYDRILASYLALSIMTGCLKVYRQRAGLPAPGRRPGRLVRCRRFCAGPRAWPVHFRTIALRARYRRCRMRMRKFVRSSSGFGETLGPDSYPYASAKAATTWPCYILDKYEIGLLDSYRLAGVAESKRHAFPRDSRRAAVSSRIPPMTAVPIARNKRLMTKPTFCPKICLTAMN